MGKQPAFPFYPGDWLRDTIAGCSLAAQGLWLRMMMLMHDAERYGYLMTNGSATHPDSIARRCGCTLEQYETLLLELDVVGVPSRTPRGIIYSRRMVRDAENRRKAAERQEKHREECNRGSNASVTPLSQPSSSSVSSSVSSDRSSPPERSAFADPVFPDRVSPKDLKPSARSQKAATSAAVWEAYREAYHHRYGTDPTRNARVNSHLAQVVKCLGGEEAPHVAAFYLSHNQTLYVRAKHPTNLLLRDCEGLRTEWATGHMVSDTEARDKDRRQATASAFAPLLAEAEEKERARGR